MTAGRLWETRRVGIRYLGPLEVEDAGSAVPVPGSRLRQLLVRLALAPGSWVPAGTLADAVWADGAPADRANSLQSLVSRLRRVLGRPELVEQSAAGYHLAVPRRPSTPSASPGG